MKSLAFGETSERSRVGWALMGWRAVRRFYERRSPYSIAATILTLASIAIGCGQWVELRSRQAQLLRISTQLDSATTQAKAELATLLQAAPTPQADSGRPPVSQQSKVASDLQKQLQNKEINTSDLVFATPVFEKEKAYWRQDTTVRLSGAYLAVKDLLLSIPDQLKNVALISIKLTREPNAVGQLECEAVLRAFYSDDRSERATQP